MYLFLLALYNLNLYVFMTLFYHECSTKSRLERQGFKPKYFGKNIAIQIQVKTSAALCDRSYNCQTHNSYSRTDVAATEGSPLGLRLYLHTTSYSLLPTYKMFDLLIAC